MAESVGKVYGTAFFQLCEEENCLEKAYNELGEVIKLLYEGNDDDVSEYVKFLSSPLISADEKVQSLKSVLESQLSALTLDFLCLVTEKGRFRYMSEIFGEFKQMYNDKMNILEVTAVTAEPLSGRLRDKLKTKLESVTGKTVLLSEKVDKSLIGGIVIRYGNAQIDSSVKTRLDKLKAQINGVIA